MKLFFIASSFLILLGDYAQAKDSRFLALGGFGQAKATSAGRTATSRLESPGGISFVIDQNFMGAYFVFAEHMRSLGAGGSSVGFTGLGLKYYPWANPLFIQAVKPIYGRSVISLDGYLPYVGASFGFVQASMLGSSSTEDVLAVAGYAAVKGGIEMPMSDKWGLVTEGNYMNSVAGSGTIQALNLLVGAYLTF